MKHARYTKVVPIQKTVGSSSCSNWEKAQNNGQPFLYITGIFTRDNKMVYICADTPRKNESGNYYAPEDLVLFIETNRGLTFLLKEN